MVRKLLAFLLLSWLPLSSQPTVLVIQNHDCCPIGTLEKHLTERGFRLRTVHADREPIVDHMMADLVVILGGPQAAYDLERYPYLLDEMRVIRERASADKPTLGLCLGGQLMAQALGGRVYRAESRELGFVALRGMESSVSSPVDQLIEEQALVYESHVDRFDPPPGAEVLARTDHSVQAFLVGSKSLAVQFHPEVSFEISKCWYCFYGMDAESERELDTRNSVEFPANAPKIERFWAEYLDWLEQEQPVTST